MQTKTFATAAALMIGLVAAQAAAAEPAKANLVAPAFSSYSITEEGEGQWRVCWQGQSAADRFHGRVYAAAGAEIVATARLPGVAVARVSPNHVMFDAATAAREKQCFEVAVHGDHDEIRIDLAVNGEEATNPFLLFASSAPRSVGGEFAALQY
jgi:hypothetical protein